MLYYYLSFLVNILLYININRLYDCKPQDYDVLLCLLFAALSIVGSIFLLITAALQLVDFRKIWSVITREF